MNLSTFIKINVLQRSSWKCIITSYWVTPARKPMYEQDRDLTGR